MSTRAFNTYLLIHYLIFAHPPSHNISSVVILKNDNTLRVLILRSTQVTVTCIISFNFLKILVGYIGKILLFQFHR